MASVLLVEDETLIRMMISDMLVELGHTVAGEAGDLRTGLTLASSAGIDVAILDVRLGANSSEPNADVLRTRNIPFVFATGYGADGVPAGYSEHPALCKPFRLEELERCLLALKG